jgi:hypothetical protein
MLIGAAVGGGSSAITGGDPLKGALIGAAGGGLGAGLGAAGSTFSATTPTVTGAATGAGTGAATGVGTGAATGATTGAGTGAAIGDVFAGFSPTGSNAAFNATQMGTAATAPTVGSTGGTAFSQLDAGGIYPGGGIAPQALPSVSTQTMTTETPFSIRDLLNKAPTPDITGSPEAQKQVAQATGKNIFGYMPGEKGFLSDTTLAAIGGGSALLGKKDSTGLPGEEDYVSSFDPTKFRRSEPTYAPGSVYVPEYKDYRTAAEGGIMRLANGGPVERMSQMNTAMNPQGGLYPQGMIDKTQYAVPTQRPVSSEMVMDTPAYERSNPMLMAEGGIAGILEAAKAQGLTPEAYQQIYGRGNSILEMQKALKEGKMVNMAHGGISSLGGYSDGGRMLKGPGDGMSDSIPGVIAGKQPARLADGEFVVPADVVSHLGNGSTDAGAKQLYSMMDKVRKARTGKKKQAPAVKANRYIPA